MRLEQAGEARFDNERGRERGVVKATFREDRLRAVRPFRNSAALTARAPERETEWRQAPRPLAETKDEAPEGPPPHDGPLLDLSDAAVKKMIKEAKKRGYVTVDELNSVLPSEEVTSEQIEDTMAMLSDMGINVVESDERDEAEQEAAEEEPEEESEGRELMPAAPAPPSPRRRRAARPPTAPTIRSACISARWARWSFSRARARSPSPSASRPAARR